MSKRLALLIGVAEYDQPAIPDLPVVHNDVRDLASVLERSNYSVRKLGTGGAKGASGNNIPGAIEDILSEAGKGDTVLIYYSGHGWHYNGKDWLLPSDGRITGSEFARYLVHLEFASFVENSKAGTVVFFIDACREGVELGGKSPLSAKEWGQEKRTRVKNRRFAMVFGCHKGDVCRYVQGDDAFSLFTRALSNALDPTTKHKTLGEVLDAVDAELKKLCKEHYPTQSAQRVRFSRETDAANDDGIRACVICEGTVLGKRPGDRKDFREPTDEQVLHAYYQDIADQHGYVRFLGLPHLRDNPDVPIDRLYVEPSISDSHIQPELPIKDWPQTTPVLQAVASSQRLVLLGDPGSGKSTLVSWIAWRLSRLDENAWKKSLSSLVPIPMVLRDMDITIDITWDGLVDAFLALPVAKALNEGGKGHERLTDLFDRGQAFIMLDGLDEIGSAAVRAALQTAVFDGFKRYTKCRWLLTSRIVGYEVVQFESSAVPRRSLSSTVGAYYADLAEIAYPQSEEHQKMADLRYVAPFSDEQIQQFAHNWYIQHEKVEHERQQRARELVGAIASNEGTRHLARIPNLLTLIALIYRVYRWLPHGRAMLYEHIAEAYLQSIDRFRGLDGLKFSLAEKKRWLAYVGFQMQLRRGSQKQRHREILANQDQVHRWIAEAMSPSVEDAKGSAKLFLDYIARRSGLLLPRGEGHFGFMHLSFQEYFAACYLAEHVTTPEWALGEKTPLGTTASDLHMYANLSEWSETLVLLFESLAEKPKWIVRLVEALFGAHFDCLRHTPARPDGSELALLAELAVDRYAGLSDDHRHRAMQRCWELELASFSAKTSPRDKLAFRGGRSVAATLLAAQHDYIQDSWEAMRAAWSVRQADALLFTDLGAGVDLSQLSSLTGLHYLYLGNTQITDSQLSHFSALSGLKGLALYERQITDAGLAHLTDLTGLQSLTLSGAQITDEGLAHLSVLTRLQSLILHDTPITDAGLAHISTLEGLQSLTLSGERITVEGLAHLSALTGLRALNLHGTPITDEGLAHLAALTGLQSLTLSCAQITVAGLAHLSALTELHTLGLNDGRITDAGLAHLPALPRLQTLYLNDTQITDAGLAHLTRCNNLEILHTRGTKVTTTGKERFLESLKSGKPR